MHSVDPSHTSSLIAFSKLSMGSDVKAGDVFHELVCEVGGCPITWPTSCCAPGSHSEGFEYEKGSLPRTAGWVVFEEPGSVGWDEWDLPPSLKQIPGVVLFPSDIKDSASSGCDCGIWRVSEFLTVRVSRFGDIAAASEVFRPLLEGEDSSPKFMSEHSSPFNIGPLFSWSCCCSLSGPPE